MKLSEFREQQEKGFEAATLRHQNTNTGNVYVLIDKPSDGGLTIEVKKYVFDGEKWNVRDLYVGNDYVCAMDEFSNCLNYAIVDPLSGLKFTCPECKGHTLECCQDGYHVSEVMRIDEDGDHDYGELMSHGDVIRWQCSSCGHVIEDSFGSDMTCNEEVAKFVKENQDEEVS